MRPSEIIREGLNLMFERGHAKHVLEGPDGSLCALGACLMAEHGTLDERKTVNVGAYAALTDAARPKLFLQLNERTFDEIVDWFHRAEKIAEQRERAS